MYKNCIGSRLSYKHEQPSTIKITHELHKSNNTSMSHNTCTYIIVMEHLWVEIIDIGRSSKLAVNPPQTESLNPH